MVEIRETMLSDIKGIVDVNTNVWQSAYQDIINETTLASLRENINDRVLFFENEFRNSDNNSNRMNQAVAVDGSKVVAFIKYGDYRDDDTFKFDKTSEIYAIYVDQAYQGNNIGKKLINFAVTKLLEKNHYDTLVIWTLEMNSYRKFYESIGGISDYSRVIEIRNQQLDELGYLFKDLNKLKILTDY